MSMNLQAMSSGLPQDIAGYIACGQWQEAQEMISARLQLELPQMLRDRLALTQVFIQQLGNAYPLSEEQLISSVRKQIPDFSDDDFRQLRNLGWLDSLRIQGRRMYFEDSIASLIKANPDFAARAGRPLSPSRPILDDAMARMRKEGVIDLRLQLTTSLQFKENTFVSGQTCYVHLPLPTPAPQQHEVQIIDVRPRPKHIARESVPQRTVYFEEIMTENLPFVAVSTFRQILRYVDPL